MTFAAIVLVAAAIPIPVADFRTPEPSLERFELAQEPAPETPEESEPSWLWRGAGYLVFAACSTAEISTLYRKDRSPGFSPTIENDAARMTATGAIAIGATRSSEWLRGRDDTQLALLTRLGVAATCIYTASNNFNKGWRRR